jgi:hypothetical protein
VQVPSKVVTGVVAEAGAGAIRATASTPPTIPVRLMRIPPKVGTSPKLLPVNSRQAGE